MIVVLVAATRDSVVRDFLKSPIQWARMYLTSQLTPNYEIISRSPSSPTLPR